MCVGSRERLDQAIDPYATIRTSLIEARQPLPISARRLIESYLPNTIDNLFLVVGDAIRRGTASLGYAAG